MAWFNPFSSSPASAPLALALQGGGAHGAFTWGVLDTLLAGTDWPIAAISGTSAGALNAVALAHGTLHGGRAGAREALTRLWTAIGTQVRFDAVTTGSAEHPELAPAARTAIAWMRLFSPYQFNPLGLNPLRELLAEQIDFDALRERSPIRLYVAATHANSGRLRLFDNRDLTLPALLASACLPTLHHAVTIDGEPYWDGGYSANPALFPLARSGIRDLLAVTLIPRRFERAPVSAEEIRDRALEFAFNASFLREATLLGDAMAEARAAVWPHGRLELRLRRLRTHLIDGDGELHDLKPETRMIAHLPFLERLRDLGRQRTLRWLDEQGGHVGRRSSVDFAAAPALPEPATAAMVAAPGTAEDKGIPAA
ncbi:MAG TPA: patatin-like phospholipase family protein [Burkholderiaceae bacterium]